MKEKKSNNGSVTTPMKEDVTCEAAQEAHEALLTGYQTERKDGKNLSLNGETLAKAQQAELDGKPKQ
jgi:hypothetical protein